MVLFGGCRVIKLIKCEVEVIILLFIFIILLFFFKLVFVVGFVFNMFVIIIFGFLGFKILICLIGNKLIFS